VSAFFFYVEHNDAQAASPGLGNAAAAAARSARAAAVPQDLTLDLEARSP
jgi:hypothetical protein